MFVDISDWGLLVGRTHPLIVHLPIGIIMIAAVFEVLTFFKRFHHLESSLVIFWIAAALTSAAACVAGLLLSEEASYDEAMLSAHQWLGIGVALLSCVVVAVKKYHVVKALVNKGLVFMVVVVLSVAGHYGGTLTHGEEYLNEPLTAIFGEREKPQKFVKKEIPDMDQAVVYRDLIDPILQQKCVKCHNDNKRKGKLRLDEFAQVVKGGKSGNTLVNGSPEESELYKRLILPEDDKKRMPPKNKPQLTKEETELIHWWIKEGKGSETQKVSEIKKSNEISLVLASYASEETVIPAEVEIPETKVSVPDPKAIKALEATEAVVARLAPELPFITVNCVNAITFGDKETELFRPLKDQIVWLRAGSTRITNKGLENIYLLTNLTRLSLEYTAITSDGLKGIGKLKELQYLNLVGTKVDKTALTYLKECKKLKVLHLWKTAISPEDFASLKISHPSLEVNFGEN